MGAEAIKDTCALFRPERDPYWHEVPRPVRKILEQLEYTVQAQAWQIRELQESQERSDHFSAALARKAESSAVTQLTQRLQTMDKNVERLSDRLCELNSRSSAAEARINFELDSSVHNGICRSEYVPDPQSSWDPVFALPDVKSVQHDLCSRLVQLSDVSIAERVARVEKRVEAVSEACVSLEEKNSSVASQANHAVASLHAVKAEVLASYTPLALLHDAEVRLTSQVQALGEVIEEKSRTANAASVAASGRSRITAIKEHVSSEIKSIGAQVALLQKDTALSHRLECRITELEGGLSALSSDVRQLTDCKADSAAVNGHLATWRAAIDETKSSVLARLDDRASTRHAEAAHLRESVHRIAQQTQAADRRLCAVENAVQHSRQASSGAHELATECRDAVSDVNLVVDGIRQEVYGDTHGKGTGRAGHSALRATSLIRRMEFLEDEVRSKSDQSVAASLQAQNCQVSVRIEEIAEAMELLSSQVAATAELATSCIAKPPTLAAIAEVRAQASHVQEELSARLARLESVWAPVGQNTSPGGLDGIPGPCTGRSSGLKQLVECAVSELEGRVHDKCEARSSKVEEALKRLSKRVVSELSAAHHFLTDALNKQATNEEAALLTISQRVAVLESEVSAVGERLQQVTDGATKEASQVDQEVKDCTTVADAHRIALQVVRGALQNEATSRAEQCSVHMEAMLDRVNDQLSSKADVTTVQNAKAEMLEQVSRQVETCTRNLERAVDACNTQCASRTAATAAVIAKVREDVAQHSSNSAQRAAESASASQLQALAEALTAKADRSEMLSAVSNIQAVVGQKVSRSEVEQALARKLDIRTFLASHTGQTGTTSGHLDPQVGLLQARALVLQQSAVSRQSTTTRSEAEANLTSGTWQGRPLPPTPAMPGSMARPGAFSASGSGGGEFSISNRARVGTELLTPQATPGPHLAHTVMPTKPPLSMSPSIRSSPVSTPAMPRGSKRFGGEL